MALTRSGGDASGDGPWHVVLGGSRGIGFAFAAWLAKAQHRLIVVARDSPVLYSAAERLRAAGAPAVESTAGDVTDPRFRAALLDRLRTRRIRSVFIGGPSPPAGPAEDVTPENVATGYRVCIEYPFDVVRALAGSRASERPPAFVFLSSSASREPMRGHPFYISALLRRSAERLLQDVVEKSTGSSIVVLRPGVIWTELSARYATALAAVEPGRKPREILARRFHVASVPDAETYIARQSRRLRRIIS